MHFRKTVTFGAPALLPLHNHINYLQYLCASSPFFLNQGELDTDEVFAVPVLEAVPDLADSYSAIVAEPMDFRTIQEERMPAYRSIRELQQDLLLVFRNCILFNEEGSPYAELAW